MSVPLKQMYGDDPWDARMLEVRAELSLSARALVLFAWGLVKRVWALVPALLMDPFDVPERLFDYTWEAPDALGWGLFSAGLLFAALMTYRDLLTSHTGLERDDRSLRHDLQQAQRELAEIRSERDALRARDQPDGVLAVVHGPQTTESVPPGVWMTVSGGEITFRSSGGWIVARLLNPPDAVDDAPWQRDYFRFGLSLDGGEIIGESRSGRIVHEFRGVDAGEHTLMVWVKNIESHSYNIRPSALHLIIQEIAEPRP